MRRLLNEHRVAKGEEAVPLPHGLLVHGQGLFPAHEGGHQHQQRGLGQRSEEHTS